MSKVFREGKFLCLYSTKEDLEQEEKEREWERKESLRLFEEYKQAKARGEFSGYFSEYEENYSETPSQKMFSEEDDRKFEQELPEWRDKENKLIDELESMDKNKDKK